MKPAKKILFWCLSGALLLLSEVSAQAQFQLDLETGTVFNSRYNEVRVPGNSGTTFDIAKGFNTDPTFFYRIRAGYTFGKRHTVSALFAPLSVNSTGSPAYNINFFGATFGEGSPLDIRYKFNSYRLTYRYNIVSNDKVIFGLGLTAKIRDASIRLRNSQAQSEKTNFGFVPLVNFYFGWQFTERWRFILEGDALASSQGRAEDIFGGLSYRFNDNFALKAGYRVLEGGADNDEVYNFTWFDYASIGAIIRW